MHIYSTFRSEAMAVLQLSGSSDAGIQGTLRGPFCRYARTLPTTYRVTQTGTVTIVDPCYWTPSMSFYYQVETHAGDRGELGRIDTFRWGIRE